MTKDDIAALLKLAEDCALGDHSQAVLGVCQHALAAESRAEAAVALREEAEARADICHANHEGAIRGLRDRLLETEQDRDFWRAEFNHAFGHATLAAQTRDEALEELEAVRDQVKELTLQVAYRQGMYDAVAGGFARGWTSATEAAACALFYRAGLKVESELELPAASYATRKLLHEQGLVLSNAALDLVDEAYNRKTP